MVATSSTLYSAMRHFFSMLIPSHVSIRFFWFVTFFFLGLTYLYISAYNPYQPTDKEWLVNPNFKLGFDHWKLSNPKQIKQDAFGVVSLSLSEFKKYLALYQRFRIDSRFSQREEGAERTEPLLLQLSGVARTFSLGQGDKAWHQGRFSLVFYDEKGKRVSINAVPLPSHNKQWREYRKVFEVPKQVASVRVNVNILQVKGTVQVKEMHLVPVELKPEAKILQILGLLIWIGMMVWLLFGYAQYVWTKSKMTMLLVLVLMFGAIMSGDMKLQLMNQLPELLFSITPSFVVDRDVLAHFLFFFVAALVMIGVFHSKRWWQVVIDLILLGLFIECAQVFVEGRVAEFMDLVVDISGIMAGGVIAGLLIGWQRYLKKMSC